MSDYPKYPHSGKGNVCAEEVRSWAESDGYAEVQAYVRAQFFEDLAKVLQQ